MTIDEAIEEYKKRAENDRQAESLYLHDDLIWNAKQEHKLAEHHEQLAEWLEELKAYRAIGTVEECKDAVESIERFYQLGYNKAIDDFLCKICEKYTEEERKGNFKQYCCNIKQELADIAEQLKAGDVE